MVARRKMIAGGLIAGLVGSLVPSKSDASTAADAAAAPKAADENTAFLQRIHEELQLQRETCSLASGPSLDGIRRQQHIFLKAQGRYPEYIDVGLGPWEELYAWHTTYQVPVKISLRQDGTYGMPFYLTTIVLKPNMQEGYVGSAYDGR